LVRGSIFADGLRIFWRGFRQIWTNERRLIVFFEYLSAMASSGPSNSTGRMPSSL
jgi:hypothetical protein